MKIFSVGAGMLFMLVAPLVSCSPVLPPDRPDLGARAKRVLPGRWASVMEERGFRGTLDKTFHKDGSAEGIVTIASRSAGLTLQAPPIPFKSRWRIEGGTIIAYDVRSQPALFPPGTILPDRVTSVSENRIEFVDLNTGRKGYLQRLE